MLFRFFGLCLCRLHGSVPVLGRSIESVESQRFAACVDDVVASARRHEHYVAIVDFRRLAVDPNFSLPFFDAEELIGAGVHFLANLLTRLQGHEDELKVFARIQHTPEIQIIICQFFDVRNKALEDCASFGLRLASGLAALLRALVLTAHTGLRGSGSSTHNRRARSCEYRSLHRLPPGLDEFQTQKWRDVFRNREHTHNTAQPSLPEAGGEQGMPIALAR